MQLTIHLVSLLAFTLAVSAAPPGGVSEYSPDVTLWKEVEPPSWVDKDEHLLWWIASAYRPRHIWNVFAEDAEVHARLGESSIPYRPERPDFTPTGGGYPDRSVFCAVDDGWLVGTNDNRTGVLSWYSRDGKQSYKISHHRIGGFISRPEGVYAFHGTGHLNWQIYDMSPDTSTGSLVRITRSTLGARWKVETVTNLPGSPYAMSAAKDGTLYLTLAESLVSVNKSAEITTLLPFREWSDFVPNTSTLSADERKLYIGMNQFVGEFDIQERRLRLLIPSEAFRARLPEAEEKGMRALLLEARRP